MERIRAAVLELTERFQTSDPFALCEYLDIEVLQASLPSNIKGFYSRLVNMPMIYLNATLEDEVERRAVCAHELGHAVLHSRHNSLFLRDNTCFVAARFEKEANLFAGYLLLDAQSVYDYRCNGWTCEQISRVVGLPEEVVLHCLSGHN